MKFIAEQSLDNGYWVAVKETATYEIYSRDSIRRLRVLRNLNARTIQILRREKIKHVQICSRDLQNEIDLNILRLMPELEAVSLHIEKPIDWTPLQNLRQIQELTLLTGGFKPQPLDFASFPRLHTVRMTWHQEWASVLSCSTLRGLAIENSRKVQAFDLSELSRLCELGLTRCSGLSRVICSSSARLESLGIGACSSFQSIEPTKAMASLKYVSLGGMSHFEIEALGKCVGLKRLSMHGVGKIKSLKFLANCRNLERLGMHFSTQVEDGDLAVLLDLPKLKTVSFRRYKNYTHTLDEITSLISARQL